MSAYSSWLAQDLLDSPFERFVRLELLQVCGNEVDHDVVRTTKRSSWSGMKGIWNGTVTMIKGLVISCRTCHMFLLREGFSQVCVIEVTEGSYYVIWVSVFTCGNVGSEVVDCCSCVGLGRYVDTNKNNRGKLAWRVEGSASDSQSFKFWRTGGGENHLWLTIKLIPQPLDLFDRSGDLSARKSV